jgi:hypothetical protein
MGSWGRLKSPTEKRSLSYCCQALCPRRGEDRVAVSTVHYRRPLRSASSLATTRRRSTAPQSFAFVGRESLDAPDCVLVIRAGRAELAHRVGLRVATDGGHRGKSGGGKGRPSSNPATRPVSPHRTPGRRAHSRFVRGRIVRQSIHNGGIVLARFRTQVTWPIHRHAKMCSGCSI